MLSEKFIVSTGNHLWIVWIWIEFFIFWKVNSADDSDEGQKEKKKEKEYSAREVAEKKYKRKIKKKRNKAEEPKNTSPQKFTKKQLKRIAWRRNKV